MEMVFLKCAPKSKIMGLFTLLTNKQKYSNNVSIKKNKETKE